jgi:hypothetical protein
MVSAAVAQARVCGLMAPERHLVRTQHSFAVEELDDYALLEMRVTMTMRMCAELGLDENETTVGQLCDAMLDAFDREQEEPNIVACPHYRTVPAGIVHQMTESCRNRKNL